MEDVRLCHDSRDVVPIGNRAVTTHVPCTMLAMREICVPKPYHMLPKRHSTHHHSSYHHDKLKYKTNKRLLNKY